MSLSAFTRELGTFQGRIVPSRLPPPEGEYVFVLGSDAPLRVQTLGAGDAFAVSQTSSNAGVRFIRPRVRFRAASSVPDGTQWVFAWYLDGVAIAEHLVERDQDLDDLAVNVAPLDPAAFELAFELRFEGPAGRYEAELPGVYLDALFLEDGDERPTFANRYPAPGSTEVPINANVELDIMDWDDVVDPASAQVWIGGVLAWNGSTFQAGFTGPGSSTTLRDSDQTLRIVVDPTAPFASLAEVSVRIRYETADAIVRDETYTFTAEDLTSPVLDLAQARNRTTVRVTFSEPLEPEAALDPANWAIEPVQGALLGWGDYRYGAAIAVSVASVTQVTSLVFDVVTDVPMTMRATYRVSVAGVSDLYGNAIDALLAVQQFESVDDRVPERKLRLIDRMPAMNIREDATQDLRKWLWAWQEPLELMLALVDEWLQILDPRTAPEPFLDAMLADLGNPFEFPLTVSQKRKLILLLVPIYKQKGSAEGIISTIRIFLGIEVTITYPGGGGSLGTMLLGGSGYPGTFVLGGDAYDAYGYIVNSMVILTDEERDKIREIAEYMQAANEHLVRIAEPGALPVDPDHLILNLSQLDVNWLLH